MPVARKAGRKKATARPRRSSSATAQKPLRESGSIKCVSRGIFFDPAGVLPRGRHKLSRGEVKDTQRERLLMAMTELLAARGYRGFGAGEIASRAGVSLAAFYDCFENKDACIFAGYERFIEVLIRRMTAIDSTSKDPPTIVRVVVAAYLQTMQSDLVVARAYQVEIDALGAPARQRRRDSLSVFAAFVRELAASVSPDGEPPAELGRSAYIGVVYALRQLVSDALDEQPAPDLALLGEDLQPWLSDVFRVR
jgi:AcrR family transcriptional regulator